MSSKREGNSFGKGTIKENKIRSRRSKIRLLFCVYTIMFTKSLKQNGEREIMALDSILKVILPQLKPKQADLNWQ